MVARRRRHVSLSEAAHDLASIIARLARRFPVTDCDRTLRLILLKQEFASTWNPLKLKIHPTMVSYFAEQAGRAKRLDGRRLHGPLDLSKSFAHELTSSPCAECATP
jgi:hypothetical protein